jgi:ethanolamine utilization cobalamin adenosyltransferase
MKFITEDELRYLYRKQPFTTYEPEPGTRLTPGARQYLLDHGIDMYDEQKAAPIIRQSLTQEVCCPSANPGHNGGAGSSPSPNAAAAGAIPAPETAAGGASPPPGEAAGSGPAKGGKKCNWRTKMVKTKLASVEANFLQTEQTLLECDVMMAQNLTRLSKQFSDIRHMIEGKGSAMDMPCRECHGITCENFSEDLEDCFEITDFHVQLEKGREILALHQLRCALREIEPVMLQAFEGNDAAIGLCADAIGKVNQVINSISQMICGAVGGKECQRKK